MKTILLILSLAVTLTGFSQSTLTIRNDSGTDFGQARLFVQETAFVYDGPSGLQAGQTASWNLDAGWNDGGDTAYFIFYQVGYDPNIDLFSGDVAVVTVIDLLSNPTVVNGNFTLSVTGTGNGQTWLTHFTPTVVPEPETNTLFFCMAASLLIWRRWSRNRAATSRLPLPGPLEPSGCFSSSCGYAAQWPTSRESYAPHGAVSVGASKTISADEQRENKNMKAIKAFLKSAGLRKWASVFVMLAVLVLGMTAQAQTNNFPDPESLITGPQTYFNTALTWVIGAIGVLMVIGWIMKAMRGRK